jgi:hypothetical protein
MYSDGDGVGSRIKKAAGTVSAYVLFRLGALLEVAGVVCVMGAFLIAPAVGFIVSGILLLLFSLAISLNVRTNAGTAVGEN